MATSNVQINPLQYYRFTWTTGASDAANSSYSATIYRSQTDTVGTDELNVPPNQLWIAVDLNESTTTTTDYTADLIIGGTPQNINIDINTTALSLGTTRINPFALMTNGGMLIGSNTTLGINIVSNGAGPSSAATYTARIGIRAVPIPKGK